MKPKPFYCRRAFWISAAGTASGAVAYLSHLQHAPMWLVGALGAVAVVCGNLGSVIAAGEGPAQGDSGNAGA